MSLEEYFDVQPQIEEVSRDEFWEFVFHCQRAFKQRLIVPDINNILPFARYYGYRLCDSELAPYPFNVIAYTDTWGNEEIYFIMKNYAEVFASRREVKNES